MIESVKVLTTDASTSFDEIVDRCVSRIVSVSDTAPEPIRAQAIAFRSAVKMAVADGMRAAIRHDRGSAMHLLMTNGEEAEKKLLGARQ
jgi:hypothetical protein